MVELSMETVASQRVADDASETFHWELLQKLSESEASPEDGRTNFQVVRTTFPRGEVRQTGLGETVTAKRCGHVLKSLKSLPVAQCCSSSGEPSDSFWSRLAGRRPVTFPRPPPLFTSRIASVSGDIFFAMGWKQYACILWLSRG